MTAGAEQRRTLPVTADVGTYQPMVQPVRGKQDELPVGIVSLLHAPVQLWVVVL